MNQLTSISKKIFTPMANPIIVKELRSRMRGARAFIILTIVLLLMALISYALYQLVIITSTWNYNPLSPQIGQTLFAALVILEMGMICLITPAITAGAISAEHENLTYEMLLTTPLKPTRILWGKLVSALSYIFLLIFAAIPMASLVFIYGGVSLREMVKALVVLFCTAIMLGTIGIFTSTWLKRTARATVVSYLIVLVLVAAPTFLYGITALVRQSEPPRWILVASPISALFSAIAPSASLGSSSLSMIGGLSMLMAGNIGFISTSSIPRPLYHYTLPLYGLLSIVLYMLSTRLVRPARRWRLRAKELLTALLVILVYLGFVALVFNSTTDRYENISIFAAPTPFGAMSEEAMVRQVTFEEAVIAIPVSEEEAVQIYSAVLHSVDEQGLLSSDLPLSISRQTYFDPVFPEELQQTIFLSDEIVEGIMDTWGGLDFASRWVDSYSDFLSESDSNSSEQAGALLILGNLNPMKSDILQVSASLYTPDLPAQIIIINLSNQSGTWEVIGSSVSQAVIFGPAIPESNADSLNLSPNEMSQIYSAVISQVYVNDTPQPGIDIPQMFIVQNTVLSDEPMEITAPVRASIESNFESMPFTITWIESRAQAPLDSASGEIDGGGLIEFGNIQAREDGRIDLMVSLHYSEAAKTLVTYILEKVPDGGWQILEFGGNG